MPRCMEGSRRICASGWPGSICKGLKVGTDLSMLEECGFFFFSVHPIPLRL